MFIFWLLPTLNPSSILVEGESDNEIHLLYLSSPYQIQIHLTISLFTLDRYFKIMVHCEKSHHP